MARGGGEGAKTVTATAVPTTASALSDDGEFDEHSEIVVQIIEGILNQTQILIFRAYLSDPHILAATKLALVRLYPQHTPRPSPPPSSRYISCSTTSCTRC